MLGNKKFNMIISVILAISLWAYVVGEINPTAERTIKDIQISFAHADVLAERGLAMSEASAYTIEVEIEGSRSEISKIGPEDISAVVDLATAAKGENEFSVSVKAPDGIGISKKSMSSVAVKIENLTKKEVPVTIHYTGTLEAPKEGETVSKSFDNVIVSGAESKVAKVKAASGSISVSELSEDVTTNKCKLIPVDRKGHQVDNVLLSKNFVSVDSIISKTKTVKLNLNIVDNSSDGMVRTADYPKEIVIAGRSDDLKKVDSIDAGTIDITDMENGSQVEINPELPEGIILSERNSSLVVKVSVEALSSRSFTISSKDISFEGKLDSLSYGFDREFNVEVTISDRKNLVDSIKKEDFTVIADVSSLKDAGTYEVRLSVKSAVSVSGFSLSPETVSVVVS